MSNKFCKLFETTDLGQLLVKIDRHEETMGPEVRFFFQPPELGVCSAALSWEDDDNGWDKAEEFFTKVDEAQVRKIVQEQLVAIKDAAQ